MKEYTIVIGKGSCGLAAGAEKVDETFKAFIKEKNYPFQVRATGCNGNCYQEPIVDIYDAQGNKTTYVNVHEADVATILEEHLVKGMPVTERMAPKPTNRKQQVRIALDQCGIIDPENIDHYIETGGYQSAREVYRSWTPEAIIEEVKISGLAGRGGAGFPTWFKWNEAKKAEGSQKYMICNADEGDPGAFMDRSVLEGNPHSVIEGMLIGAKAIGAEEGVVYVRAEYPLAIARLTRAIDQALERGFLGEGIFDTEHRFHLRIKAGAGAFVCGEETALIASLEGERGMPRLKPPFPAQKGYWGQPTNINNVETLANIPWIFKHGGKTYAEYGNENSKGTKVFALTGKIQKGGLVEIPMGYTLRDVIEDIGGGVREGRKLKAVQMGGPSGGCIPAEKIDTVIDYPSVSQTGAIMGSGGMVVMDDTTCMVDMARFFLDFTRKESCGKCNYCRIGTLRLLEILNRITEGKGQDGDIELLEELCLKVKEGSMCGLGQTAPNPVLTTLRYFRNEYEDHIYKKQCTAHSCRALLTYTIDEEACVGCTRCAKNCPVQAISGDKKKPHVIDQEVCIQCGKCLKSCKFNAVLVD